jgi:hypothetical protein
MPGAKNEALFPGRVPHVRPGVHPDFLSSSLALTNFMRLSLMKAAHASGGGAPYRKSGTMGRKRILQMLSLYAQELSLLAALFFALMAQALKGAAPHLFRSMYAEANMGHPSGTKDFS